jgi:hypothetical protein
MALTEGYLKVIRRYQHNWNAFAGEVLGVSLDDDQQSILHSVQEQSRTAVKSGHARGKDFVASVCITAFHYLNYPSKVVCTGPTDRQVKSIVLAEAKERWMRAAVPLGGRFLDDGIKHDDDPNWFVLGFKARDKRPDEWTGFHSANVLVVVTEASGVEDDTFNAVEGLLTGNSRLLLTLNPNRATGEAFHAFTSPQYQKFTLSCLDAPNVRAGKIVIPGQVDAQWIDSVIAKPGWAQRIDADAVDSTKPDFEWRGQWYRPGDLFRIKVLGLWPEEPEDQLIPISWIEAANERWRAWKAAGGNLNGDPMRIGADVAGMGADLTSLCYRCGPIVSQFQAHTKSDHMMTVGRIKAALEANKARDARAFVDTIGEGAGVYSRLHEQECAAVSVKFSASAHHRKDVTGQRKFANLRAYCWWAIRDALDPRLGGTLALPPFDELTQDLTTPRWEYNSQGRIVIEKKDEIKSRLGRSPDFGDSLALTFAPHDVRSVETFT